MRRPMVVGSNLVFFFREVFHSFLEFEFSELLLCPPGCGELVTLHLIELGVPMVVRPECKELGDVGFRLGGEQCLGDAKH